MTTTTDNNDISKWLPWVAVAVMAFLYFQNKNAVPIDPVNPTPDVEIRSDKALVEGSTKAAKAFVSSMAEDLEFLAADAVQGKVKKVSDAAKVNIESDESTRAKFKAAMAELWKGRLGDGDLPPSASQVFLDTANGFRKAVK